ncbi:MAG: hypothetical protein ABIB61_01450 [Candidatus Shapirobacteria bacterium]
MQKTIKNVAGQLESLVMESTAKAATEPLGIDKLGGSGTGPAAKKADPNLVQMVKNDQARSQSEINQLRGELTGRNVEKEIKEVREKKEQLLDEKEKQLLADMQKEREREEELALQDIPETSSRPKMGSALAKGSKGTKEVDMRRSV